MIETVKIDLDEDIPEYMNGIKRCASIISVYTDGNEENHQELIDNTEYHSVKELIEDIAHKLNVDVNIITIGED